MRTVLAISAVVVELIVGIVLFPVSRFLASVLIGNALGNVVLVALTY